MSALTAKLPIPTLNLPPGYSLVTLRESGDAFAHACRIAPQEGAGTFVWVRRFDVLEFAVVLEPEEPLVSARRAVFAGMSAMADALGSFAPPEKAISFGWPTTVHVDGGRVGGARLGWPESCREDEVPSWLVFGATLLGEPVTQMDTGVFPAATWLTEEGFEPADREVIVESFARHLMVAFDAWQERGFEAVATSYLARLPPAGPGRRGIDGNGDLLVHGASGVDRVALRGPLEDAAWLDRTTGMPRLEP
jgi:biotin-(acetyl-CoA carboxylase) ligase